MQQALEALEDERYVTKYTHIVDAIIALRKALEQPEQRKPLTDEEAHKTLLGMAEHIETFGDANTTDQQLSAECIRFILDQVAAHGIEEGT